MVLSINRLLRQTLIAGMLVGIGCTSAVGQPGESPRPGDAAGFLPSQQGAVTLQQAIAIALERLDGGRVVRAETVRLNGLRVHEILIIRDDGLVRTVHVDPASGRVL